MLRVAPPSTCNTQQDPLQVCMAVAQRVHTTQHADMIEFESLLAIVAPSYKTPAHELDEIREAAKADLVAAICAYRLMARHIERK